VVSTYIFFCIFAVGRAVRFKVSVLQLCCVHTWVESRYFCKPFWVSSFHSVSGILLWNMHRPPSFGSLSSVWH